MKKQLNRRQFLGQSAAVGGLALAGAGVWSSRSLAESNSPNEKLNVAMVGVAGRAADNLREIIKAKQYIVAICDIDDIYVEQAAKHCPKAEQFSDFRKMIDKKYVDAVLVACADHTHAPATVMALNCDKHAYCEKPLTHDVHEARVVTDTAAAKPKLATQLGTQMHAEDNYRRVVEAIQAGAIGQVTEVHTCMQKNWGGRDADHPTSDVPLNLHWDLWLGPAAERPYSKVYLPHIWPRWWDFGNGTLGDMGCHYLDVVFWALKLKYPTSVEASGPEPHPLLCPEGMRVKWEFPARGDMGPVAVHWYDHTQIPKEIHGYKIKEKGKNKKGEEEESVKTGVLFVGTKGMLFTNYSKFELLPEKDFKDYQRPKHKIAKSVGHHVEWINACKTGSPTLCPFSYSGPLTETVLLGNVAFRTGKKLEWDAVALEAKNAPEAQQYVKREYRKGWTL